MIRLKRKNGGVIAEDEDKTIKELAEENKDDLGSADLRGADLRSANLGSANLRSADLGYADLGYADLRDADLGYADLRDADLGSADLRSANLGSANLRSADLSQAKGILSQSGWTKENMKTTEEGIVAYKTFGDNCEPPESWKIAEGAVLEEVVNPCRTVDCACGVNIATLEWCKKNSKGDIWKVLIPWEDAPGIVVPYGTDGKCRCERCRLIGKVGEDN